MTTVHQQKLTQLFFPSIINLEKLGTY